MRKCYIFDLFGIGEIHKINFKNPNDRNLDLQVKVYLMLQKFFSRGNRFYRGQFLIWSHDNILQLCCFFQKSVLADGHFEEGVGRQEKCLMDV